MSNVNNINPVRCGVRRALLASTIASMVATPQVLAQDDDAATLEEIVVTGSRIIRNRDFQGVSPIATVDANHIVESGNVTLEDTLNAYPQLNPDDTSASNQSGTDGVLAGDLRGLGSVRTLVLVDGKRFIPGGVTGLVDMAAIPDMLIEKVEIVTGGASAVYGSDAIAGAVNFILKDDFQGVDLRYQYGQATGGQRYGRDNTITKIDVLLGSNTDDGKGNITLHASYTSRDPVFMENREFSIQPWLADSTGQLNKFGSGNIPGGKIYVPSSDFSKVTINGVDLTGAAANCTGGRIQGVKFGLNAEPSPFCRDEDQFNYAETNYILRPLDRWQISALARYEVSDNVEAYAQFFTTKKENEWQMAYLATAPTSAGNARGFLDLPDAVNNPVYPAPLRAFFSENASYFDADGDGTMTTSGNGRRFVEFGPRNAHILHESLGMTGGLRGEVELGSTGNVWNWDVFYQYQRSDVNLTRQGLLSQSRTSLGLDVVVVDGVAKCRSTLLNCVPVNVYGTDQLTEEMAGFLSVVTGRTDYFTRQTFGGSFAGNLIELPGGPLGAALGFEYRDEYYQTNPDEISASGDLGGTAPIYNTGEFDLFEAFAEVRLPISNIISLEAAIRASEYSTMGGVFTWRTGVDFSPTDSLTMRASASRAIRAPNLDELYSPQIGGFGGGLDPCVAVNKPTAAQKDFCVTQGVPSAQKDSLETPASEGWRHFVGGNPNLQEEESDTYTVGIVLTPPQIEGFSIAVDYWNIEINDAISSVNSQTIVNNCYDVLDPTNPSCLVISRDPLGNIDQVDSPLLNLATRLGNGVDLQFQYQTELSDFFAVPGYGASLDIRLVSTWHESDATIRLAGEAPNECAGRLGGTCSANFIRATPGMRAMLSGRWSSGPASVRTSIHMIGKMTAAADAYANNALPIAAQYYWDVSGNYAFNEKIDFFGGVNNVLNEGPPVIGFRAGGDSNTQAQLYDTVGRRYFVGATYHFGQ
jgi:outer membrane receptor protein involved in Fe transport